MTQLRVNYDKIAPHYNRRYETKQSEGIRSTLVDLINSIDAQMILEVGCGTAYWLATLEKETGKDRQLYGVDLSFGMLKQAQQRQKDIKLQQGAAERLPVENDMFDLIFCVNAIHHFADPRAFIHEARRALRPGGSLALIGSNPLVGSHKWFIYEYFPGTYQRDVERFPSWGAIINWVIQSGFSSFNWCLAENIHEPLSGTHVLDDPFLEKNAVSQLALLSDQEYASGIERINEALAEAEHTGMELVFNCDISVHMLTATIDH